MYPMHVAIPSLFIVVFLYVDIQASVGDRIDRDSFDSRSVRKHFLTKMDINNIQMKVKDFSIKRHENDALSVNVIVEELRGELFNPVLIY